MPWSLRPASTRTFVRCEGNTGLMDLRTGTLRHNDGQSAGRRARADITERVRSQDWKNQRLAREFAAVDTGLPSKPHHDEKPCS